MHPIVYVTAHLPDDQRGGSGSPSNPDYKQLQVQRFVTRTQAAVDQVKIQHPEIRVRLVDQYTPFTQNLATTAFPTEVWSTGGVPDYAKIGRTVDPMHPRRLASIYAGELAANAIDLTELTTIQ
jgi:hypothetical protein